MTLTEQETFQTLLQNLRDERSQTDPLDKIRQKAWDHYLHLGLPSKKSEAYRHIKLRQLFSLPAPAAKESEIKKEQIADWTYPECRASVLVFVNGIYREDLSDQTGLPAKLVIAPLQEAMQTYGALLNNHWAKSLKDEADPFAVLNGALHPNGVFLYLPPKSVVESPIQLLHLIDTSKGFQLTMPRLHIFAGAFSSVKLFSIQKSIDPSPYFVNQTTELVLEEGAHVDYTQTLCTEQPQAWHLDALRATLKKNSILKTICVTEGSATVRNDFKISLAGENAEALLNGIWMLGGKREAHTHVLIDHQAPHCRSYQLFKGVLTDFSRSSFEGKILVRQAAQKTEAFQLNQNLILDSRAHADSKPNLEIFADDVKASHGATVGQLDAEQLFYMKTRGFSEEEAKDLLIYGFCEQVLDMITLPSLRGEIDARMKKR
jgi:Fe-S cluster assembly protein SufD